MKDEMLPIFLSPVLKETPWGGRRLEEFGCVLEEGKRFGEEWAISAHPNGESTVKGGEFDGMRLSQLWAARRDLFGGMKGERFPLLTKIIDAADDLSIQVHPDDSYAAAHENGSLGKTECWLVLDAKPGATIVIGHNARDKAEVKAMIEGGRWKEFVREVPVHKGDFFFIPPGTLHAIKGGTLILETQQNSDITYRVYDWGRMPGGKARQLHIQQSIDVITAPFVQVIPPKLPGRTCNKNMEELAGCSLFSVWKLHVEGVQSIVQDLPFMLLSVVEGGGTINGIEVRKGTHCILPCGFGSAVFEGNMEAVISASNEGGIDG